MAKYNKTLVGIQRTSAAPFEADTVFDTILKAGSYANGGLAYNGQYVSVSGTEGVFPFIVDKRMTSKLKNPNTGMGVEWGMKKTFRIDCTNHFVLSSSNNYTATIDEIPVFDSMKEPIISALFYGEYSGGINILSGYYAYGRNYIPSGGVTINLIQPSIISITINPNLAVKPMKADCIVECSYFT